MTHRRVAWIGVGLSIAGICFFTLRPGGYEYTNSWSFYLTSGDAALAELIQNLILFIPLGASLAAAFPRRPFAAVVFGALLSFSIEFAQQYIPGRDPSLGDIVANTISTALGVLLVVSAHLWLWAPPRRSSWQALATAILAVTVWSITGVMVKPDPPPPPYTIERVPNFNHFGRYRGEVLDVRSRIGALQVTATAGPYPPGRTSPLIAVVDTAGHQVFVLSVDGPDLTLRYYMPALRWTLEQPDLRIRDALKDVAPRDTFTAATWRDSTGRGCLRLNTTEQCNLGYTIGDGWKLIYYPERRAPWIKGWLNTLWLAGTVVGVGFWAARGRRDEAAANNSGAVERRARGAALALVIAGLLMVPLITGLKPTPLTEWIGVLGGIAAGFLAARVSGLSSTPPHPAARYTAPPSHPGQTN